jgi:hypothetical protein
MVSKTQQKRIDSEIKRKQRYDKYTSEIKELTMKATGKKGYISFYKNCTWVYGRNRYPRSRITWDHYFCDEEPVKLFNYFTKGRLRLLEMYMPNYYDFINKHYILCIELLKETDNMFGHGHRNIMKNTVLPPREPREGQHYYNGSLFYVIETLKRQLVLLENEKSKYLHKIFLLKTVFNKDIVNNVQSFISSAYSA